ncbi:MAG: FecR domain-containing protein [Candidatus Gracilibacteria bacterium]|nr:FecR domain-containing protein [Candidatus Gracilibacteria bacterium]
MQKIENKFIYFILILIIFIIGFSVYISVFKKGVDRNSYVVLVEGEAYLNNDSLSTDKKEKLSLNDVIKTTKENSLAIIEWGDGSVTRLGGNTSIVINELFVSTNVEKLNISFELLSGKTWSNVISFIPEESYFKETFADTEAAIRGTIFNLDLDKDYLYVIDHNVTLTKDSGETIKVPEKEPIVLSSFTFISLDEFIKNIRDNAFDEINRKFDLELFNKLKIQLEEKLQSLIKISGTKLDNLSLTDKEKLYNDLLSSYQNLNFISSSDNADLFNLKISIKEKLLEIAPDSEKENILNSFLYDFKDSIKNKSYDTLDKIVGIFSKNSTSIQIKEEVLSYLNTISFGSNIKESIINNISTLKNNFSGDVLNKETIIDKTIELKTNTENIVKEKLDNLINN